MGQSVHKEVLIGYLYRVLKLGILIYFAIILIFQYLLIYSTFLMSKGWQNILQTSLTHRSTLFDLVDVHGIL
jgi:hypothetical protein